MSLTIKNDGTFGDGFDPYVDCYLGDKFVLQGAEYPSKSRLQYLWTGALWIGAVVGADTLVSNSVGNRFEWSREFSADAAPTGDIVYRSNLDPDAPEFAGSVSEEDYFMVYYDTLQGTSWDYFERRTHRPMGLKVTQGTHAWSYPYAEDFILVDLNIKNIGTRDLNEVYIGLYVDADVGFAFNMNWRDDACGFLKTYPAEIGCGYEDTVEIAWQADADGDPVDGEFIDYIRWNDGREDETNPGDVAAPPQKSSPHAIGIRVLKKPAVNSAGSFNWWISSYFGGTDFGPRRVDNFRDFGTGGLGTPIGDRNKYHVMSNREIDYDPVFIKRIFPMDPEWLYPPQDMADLIADGFDSRFLLTYGPVNLPVGSSMPFVYTIAAGENFHHVANNISYLPNNPNAYYANLDFSDLVKNTNWAARIFDNPGVDTDGDGYFGKSRICVHDSVVTESGWVATSADTVFYEGDGIPDWKAAGPPPAPVFWVEPQINGLRIRFNGSRSETEKDLFTNIADFEGYHIWLGRDDRVDSYSLVASLDLEDYDKFIWNPDRYPYPEFELFDRPMTVEELRCLYGKGDEPCDDSLFDPFDYGRDNPYFLRGFPESTFYFAPHNFNASEVGISTSVKKVYPDAPRPPDGIHPDSLDETFYTDEGYLKYYEYEYYIGNLLSTVSYWVNVTVYDFGSPESSLFPLETRKTVGAQFAYPLSEDAYLLGDNAPIYVYPNPYRIDANYRRSTFEGRGQSHLPDEKVRAINFMNLPPKCTIRIFTLDGDLVRQIDHDKDPSAPDVHHNEWNLVTRNRQAVVSGMYYWSVESSDGEVQMGKLVILF